MSVPVWLGLACSASLPSALAVTVIGSLSNFDVYNRTGDSCEGFEIEMEGVDPSDVYSLYNPWGYATMTVAIPGGTRVTYDGRSAGISVADGGVKHYGVHLYSTPTRVTYNWLATTPTGDLAVAPITAPAPLPLPTPAWTTSDTGVTAGLFNSTDRPLWLKAAHSTHDTVAELDDLLVTSPFILELGDEPEDAEAQLLDPGDTLSEAEDILAATTAGGRAVFWVYAYTGPVDDSGNAEGSPTFELTAGDRLGTVMTAVNFGVIPEPPAYGILSALGLFGLAAWRRRVNT